MKELYIEAINRFMESKQMKDYLLENIDILVGWQIVELVCGARADLKDKYEMLKKLSEKEPEETKQELHSATSAMRNAETALEGLTVQPGEVFLNVEYGYDRDIQDEKIYGAAPHFALESVMKYINEDYAECDDEENKNRTDWYRLEKYVPGVIDDLDMPYDYTIAPNGEIWFTDNVNFQHRDFASSQHLSLPVPFEIGDIITIDCRPFALVKHAVIVEIGDNWGCCSVQCMWIDKQRNVNRGALKHASVFDEIRLIRISPLYRAEVFEGELPENEAFLKEISEFVYKDEEKGKALWNYSYENEKNNGSSIEMIKDYIAKVENRSEQ